MSTVRDLIESESDDVFLGFDLTEVKEVLITLSIETAVDLPQAENMQRMSLRGADILSDYLGKIVKIINDLDAKLNKAKNQALLDYDSNSKTKTSADLRKAASEADPNVEVISLALSKAKAAKFALDKKYDILIRSHHYYKDIAAGFKRTIGTESPASKSTENSVGW